VPRPAVFRDLCSIPEAGGRRLDFLDEDEVVTLRDVDNQEEHHRKSTFQDAYRELLRLHGQSWDEKYVRD